MYVVSKLYLKSLQFNNKKTNIAILKMEKWIKKFLQMTNNFILKKEWHDYSFHKHNWNHDKIFLHTQISVAVLKENNNIHKDLEKLEPTYIDGGNVKWSRQCGKQLTFPQKFTCRIYHLTQKSHSKVYARENCNDQKPKMYSNTHSSIVIAPE